MQVLPVFEMAAIAAAMCWATASLVSAGPSSHLGAIRFNRTRMVLVFVMLTFWSLFSGGFATIAADQLPALLLSGLIGIFVGDTALFLTLNRMGPRRTAILFATNAPMAVVLGWLFLGEALSPKALGGIALVFVGVVLAIAFGKRRSQLHHWETIKGPVWQGILLGLTAGLCQAVAAIITRPIMQTGVDAAAASSLRVGISAICLVLLSLLPVMKAANSNPFTPGLVVQIALSGLLGMGLGMTLVLFALSGGEAGIVTTLSSMSPALILPLVWIKTGERPAMGAWAGAVLVVIGSALIFKAN